jgi:DNA-binding MarR family transcriptional regulator
MAPALMRRGHEAAMTRLFERWADAGFDDVRLSHSPVLGFPGPHKARPSEIATRTGRSRQHINILLNELEAAGYLVRVPDPEDNRGKIVMLTDRGIDLMTTGRKELEAIEADWERKLGKQRFAALKRSLTELGEEGTAAQDLVPFPDRKESHRHAS